MQLEGNTGSNIRFRLVCSRLEVSEREAQAGFASMIVGAVDEFDRPGMSHGNLLCKNQSDTGATWLGGVKRYEKIAGIGQPRTIVEDNDTDIFSIPFPKDLNRWR